MTTDVHSAHGPSAFPPAAAMPSYVSGVSEVPLLGETIGANFARMAAANPGREALVDVPSGRRWTYA